MGNIRLGAKLALGCLIVWGEATVAQAAAPTVQQVLTYRPKQDMVQITTPQESDYANCKVEVVKGAGNTSAWVLKDARGQTIRRFADTKGTGKVDTFSYYLDGQEVYRETDTNANRTPDQFRWLGAGGMRWGVDLNEDGQIDGWMQISAEEVSQEILRAIATKNMARLQALIISEKELKALELSQSEFNRIRDSVNAIPAKFQETLTKLSAVNETARWQHLETTPPQCIPAEQIGSKFDLIRYRSGTILFECNNKHDWVQTGEMIQIGRAWRIVSAPTPGHAIPEGAGGDQSLVELDDSVKDQIAKLQELDKGAAQAATSPAESVRYNLARVVILEQIVAKSKKPEQADQWIRQIADCLSAAAQNSTTDTAPYQRLVTLRDQLVKVQPGSPLAGYVTFREMSAEYSLKLSKPDNKGNDLSKIQEGWRERLKSFVEAYPTAEDTPDALLQLGMVSEFMNKETEAKNFYEMLAKNYAKNPLAAKAQGALKRLTLDGKTLELAGPVLGSGQPFDIKSMAGKLVVVYYWASWNQQCAADFIKLKTLASNYGSKGVEIVCVNLDNSATEAAGYLQKTQAPGTHLHQPPGGLDSPLAVQYGVMVLPNLFLVGKDGKVVSHTVQIGGLEDEIKKLLEK